MHEIDLDQEPTPHELVPVTQSYVAEAEQVALSPLDVAPEVFRAGLARREANRQALIEWVRQAMVKGVDYGVIETKRGPSRPSLWKPGAEKICGKLEVIPMFPSLAKYEEAAYSGVPIETIVLRCELMYAGNVVAQGIGCRSVAKENGDINKAFKMAAKCAQIDATLRLAGLSEVFTQDLEDMPNHEEIVVSVVPEKPSAPLSPAVQEVLNIAKANREREQAELDKRKPVDRQALRNAGFHVQGCECGAEIGTYTHATKHYKFEQCSAVKERKVPFSKEHHYKRLG